MYNPPQGEDYEYLEIHNTGDTPVDLEGWGFIRAIDYTFPAGISIAPGGYLVLCRSRDAILQAYPSLAEELIVGEYMGHLANEGEQLTLAGPEGQGENFLYDDDTPWDFLADGFGASLERVCVSTSPGSPENWRASAVPSSPEEYGGSPGGPGGPEECPPALPERPPVLISEILYHPVLEEALEEYHEFVEIHNAGPEPVSLDGWRLAGGIDYPFPPGASIAPGAYRVIAKDRSRLAAVEAYSLVEADLFGDYTRSLDNGGDKIALIGESGQGVDSVSYDDDEPWPLGADALGAGRSWLRPELLPLEDHRYMGHSLERVSFEIPAGYVFNWAPSPLDGATPGRRNAAARTEPLPIVVDFLVQPAEGEATLIRSDQEVLVQARFSPAPPAGSVQLEYFIDDVIGGNDSAPVAIPMFDDGQSGGDVLSGDWVYSATLPAQATNTLVRYRFLADLGEGIQRISPRLTDPKEWHAYFVSPVIDTETRVYQLLISPVDWGRLYSFASPGRASGCNPNPNWDRHVPAVFVHEGTVYDAHVRYQGSRWNRTNGRSISGWPNDGTRPASGPLVALSWRIGMPRYNQLEGKGALILNKLTQGCPGYNAGVGYRLFEEADVPGCQTRFVRFHVNGHYYHYMLELERAGDEMMARYHREMREKYPHLPREPVGHLFKSKGCNCDEGPWGWGDARALNAYCGYTKEQRYEYTYERKTHEWDSHAEFIALIEDLHTARRGGVDAMRAYFEERFDIDLLLNYIAIINWSVPFDDMFQNHYLYQRLSDGKWFLIPWDLDRNFGEWQGPNSSVYMGELGNPDNRSNWANFLKDAFLKSFRDEFDERLLLLSTTVLHPDNVARLVDEVTAQANPTEAAQAPGGVACSFPGRAASFKSFAVARHSYVLRTVAGVRLVDAGPDQVVFTGTTVQFDATATDPDPGPDVVYTWDNGMEGEAPTWVFQEPGDHVVTLTVTVKGLEFEDTVTITVLPIPELAHKESDGQVVLEAESFFMNERHEAEDAWWEEAAASPGHSGSGYMEARFEGERRPTFYSRYARRAPELRYTIQFETPGTYRCWLRGLARDTLFDTCHVSLDGEERSSTLAHEFDLDPESFLWSGRTRRDEPQLLEVTEAGLHLLSIWPREAGVIVDKILLTRDAIFVPTGEGPPESPQGPVSGSRVFVRGDADEDARITVSDAVAILLHVSNSGALGCEDHGDVDDNGSVEVTDAISLLVFLFQRGPLPADPFPDAGYDMTADSHDCGSP